MIGWLLAIIGALLVGAAAGWFWAFYRVLRNLHALGQEHMAKAVTGDGAIIYRRGMCVAFDQVHHHVQNGLAGAELLTWLRKRDAEITAEAERVGHEIGHRLDEEAGDR